MKSRVVAQLVSQGSTSASNFFLFAIAAKQLEPTDVGVLAVCYVPFSLGLGLIRAYSSEPLVLPARDRDEPIATLGPSIALAALGSVSLVCTSWILGASVGVWLAIIFPLAVLQDVARYLGFAQGRVAYVATADVLWLLCQAPVTLVLVGLGEFTLTTSVVGYLAGCLLAFAVMAPILLKQAVLEWKRRWRLDKAGVGLVLDFVAGRGAGDLLVPVAATFVSLPFAGALRLSQQLLGPINVVQTGLRIETTRQIVSRPHTVARALETFGRRNTAVLSLSAVLILLFSNPLSSLFADSWPLMIGIIPFLYVEKLLEVYSSKKGLQLRLSNLLSVLARTRWNSVTVLFAILLVGSSVFGYKGYLAGLVIGAIVALILWQRSCSEKEFPNHPSNQSDEDTDAPRVALSAISSGFTEYEREVVAALARRLQVSPSKVSLVPSGEEIVPWTEARRCGGTRVATNDEHLVIIFQPTGEVRRPLSRSKSSRDGKNLLVEQIVALCTDLAIPRNAVVMVGQVPPKQVVSRLYSVGAQERQYREIAQAAACRYVSVSDILSTTDVRLVGTSPDHLSAVDRVVSGIVFESKGKKNA